MLHALMRVLALWPRRETVALPLPLENMTDREVSLAKRKLELELREAGMGRGAAKTAVRIRFGGERQPPQNKA